MEHYKMGRVMELIIMNVTEKKYMDVLYRKNNNLLPCKQRVIGNETLHGHFCCWFLSQMENIELMAFNTDFTVMAW